jgi:hypothetical protein
MTNFTSDIDRAAACPELGAPGYDPFGPLGANLNLLIGTKAVDPVSGATTRWPRSADNLCRSTSCIPIVEAVLEARAADREADKS